MGKSKTARKGIKNYTTTISVNKTILEIEDLLTRYGAKKILKEYDDDQNITHLTFMVKYENGFVPIRLPSNPEKIIVMLNEKADAGDIPKKFKNDKEQAARIMWRVVLDWIDAQMTMIDIGQKSLLQIFLADVCPVGSDETYFQKFLSNDLSSIYIEDRREHLHISGSSCGR